MSKLEEGGIEITALHNHLLRNEPFTMYMHVMGHGEPAKLASTLHAALLESKTPLSGAAIRQHSHRIEHRPGHRRDRQGARIPGEASTAVSIG